MSVREVNDKFIGLRVERSIDKVPHVKFFREILQNPERSLLEARKSWHPPRHEAKQP